MVPSLVDIRKGLNFLLANGNAVATAGASPNGSELMLMAFLNIAIPPPTRLCEWGQASDREMPSSIRSFWLLHRKKRYILAMPRMEMAHSLVRNPKPTNLSAESPNRPRRPHGKFVFDAPSHLLASFLPDDAFKGLYRLRIFLGFQNFCFAHPIYEISDKKIFFCVVFMEKIKGRIVFHAFPRCDPRE